MIRTVIAIVVGVLLGASGCGKDDDGPSGSAVVLPRRPDPVLLVGVDGLEWDVMLPMLRAGRLPAMAALMERGTYGFLVTLRPTLSPVVWTTVATGKMPEKHGIFNFVKPFGPDKKLELYTSRDRRTKAVWNIVSDYDRRVAVVGWWMTFPAEPINGVMVAQTNTTEQFDTTGGKNVWKGVLRRGLPGQVHPSHREQEVMAVMAEAEASLPALIEGIFGRFRYPVSALGARLWNNCSWSFRSDATYVRITEMLLAEAEPYDLVMVYLGGPDVAGHRFWRYRFPSRFKHPPTREQIANFGQVIEDYYAYVDGIVGRLISQAGVGVRVIVVSDHGMSAVNRDGEFDPNDRPSNVMSGHHLAAESGVILAAGPGICRASSSRPPERLERYDLRQLASVLDIAPMVLTLMSLPLGEDLAGRVREKLVEPALLAAHPVRTVPTHDSEAWLEAHRARPGQVPGHDERIEQLQALGYIAED